MDAPEDTASDSVFPWHGWGIQIGAVEALSKELQLQSYRREIRRPSVQ